MAHIVDTLAKHFTGHVGPVRFIDGHANCDDADLIEFFLGQPDRYVVEGNEQPTPRRRKPRTEDPEPEPDTDTTEG